MAEGRRGGGEGGGMLLVSFASFCLFDLIERSKGAMKQHIPYNVRIIKSGREKL